MKPYDALPGLLWPFASREVYAFVLGGTRFVFDEPPQPEVAIVVEDIRTAKLELVAALKAVRAARAKPDARTSAGMRIVELRRLLIRKHMRLRKLSIGYQANRSAPVQLWP